MKPTNQPAIYGKIRAGNVYVQKAITHRRKAGELAPYELGLAKVFGVTRVVCRRWTDSEWMIMDGRSATAREFRRTTIGA